MRRVLMKLTLSLIKADIGSIGGHTKPSNSLLQIARQHIQRAIDEELLLDGFVSHTGDDIALLMSHVHGENNTDVHQFAWQTFCAGAAEAQNEGLYGAGQDLLVDAPSGNIRGAGPGIAEIEFDFHAKERPAEPFMMFAADKCDPGIFNLPLFLSFADPMFCAGLMLPNLISGFTFDILDMNNVKEDSFIDLSAPEDYYKITVLLRDNERFGIDSIRSRRFPHQKAAAVSAQRLHSIAGKYVGKDDPVALVRTQGIFPAPEEVISPYMLSHYVGGDSRGSHVMPIMPVPINTAVTGPYCLPIISCLGFSVNQKGCFSYQYVDFFDNPVWDYVRLNAQKKALEIRKQGWSGAAMLPYAELEYSGFRETIGDLLKRFAERKLS